MRIVFDLQGAQCDSRHRGIGRYSMAIVKAMLALARQRGHESFVVLNGLFPDSIEPIRAALDGLLPQEQIRVWYAIGPVKSQDAGNDWRRHTAEYLREAFIAQLRPDVVHISSLMEGFDDDAVHSIGLLPAAHGTAVTFYDVIPLIQSDIYLDPHPAFAPVYREKLEYLRRADMVLAISQSSRQEAITHLGYKPESCVNIGAAGDACFRPIDIAPAAESKLRQKLKLDRPFIMYSGATDDRKNHLRLIQAYARLPRSLRQGHQLALVGRLPKPHRERFERAITDCGLSLNDVVITGGVSDFELTALYNLCHLFVFPSWHEGFGLPALEAMACGAAVIGSNTTSVPEVIGLDEALFNPFDPDDIAAKIQQVLEDEGFRQRLRTRATGQAALFSWSRSARIALDHMESWVNAGSKRSRSSKRPWIDDPERMTELLELLGDAAGHPKSESEVIQLAAAVSCNSPAEGRARRLYVDVTELIQRDSRTGIQRVVRAVLAEIHARQLDGFEVHAVGALHSGAGYQLATDFLRRFLGLRELGLHQPCIDDAQPGDIFLGLDFQSYLTVQQEGYLRMLRQRGVSIHFVLYDLLPILQAASFPPEWNLTRIHTAWLNVLAHGDGVACISQAVADEFLAWLAHFGPVRQRPLRVGWFHLGADVETSSPTKGAPADASALRASVEARTTFLSVGTLEPRKRYSDVLDAADACWAQGADFNVLIVGRKGWHVEALGDRIQRHAEYGTRLHWVEGASDEFVDELYNRSDALIAASIAEGFGLPLVEAARRGLPVIARDIAVFREVAGPDTVFFDTPEGSTLASVLLARCAQPRLTPAHRLPRPVQTWKQATDDLLAIVMGERSYSLWHSPEKVQRLWATDHRFGTEIGEKINQEVVLKDGRTGCGLYGPYLDLEAGRYEIILRGRCWCESAGDAHLEVTKGNGNFVIAKTSLQQPDSPMSAVMARLALNLTESHTGIEFRVRVNQPVQIALTLVEIRQLDAD